MCFCLDGKVSVAFFSRKAKEEIPSSQLGLIPIFRVRSESDCVSPKGGDKDGFGEMQWSSVIMANEFVLPQERGRLLTSLAASWCG